MFALIWTFSGFYIKKTEKIKFGDYAEIAIKNNNED